MGLSGDKGNEWHLDCGGVQFKSLALMRDSLRQQRHLRLHPGVLAIWVAVVSGPLISGTIASQA